MTKGIDFNQENKSVERLAYLDWLRCFSALFVIMIHVSSAYWYSFINDQYFYGMTFFNALSRVAVPTFTMISGILLIPKQTNGKYIFKKFVRMLLLFYGWSFFYAYQGLALRLAGGGWKSLKQTGRTAWNDSFLDIIMNGFC